jgi:ribonuclease P protein component
MIMWGELTAMCGRRRPGEASLSTEPPPSEQDPRVPGADAHAGRAECPAPATTAGQAPPGALIGDSSGSGIPGGRRGRLGRLRGRAEYSRVYREGFRYPGNALVLFFRSTGTPWKVGVTAGRGLGGAVARNRAKRRLREALRRLEGCLSCQGEIVLVARPLAGTARFSEVVEELEALCRAGHLLCEGNR